MFFDIVLLNPQHRGQFGKAWVAGTRGVKFISKNEIKAVDIAKLCELIINYIATDSKSPQKRFSLRLSAVLLIGTLRIFRQQSIIFQGEIFAAYQTIRTPVRISSISDKDGENIFGDHLTPIAIVKTKKKSKKEVITNTPDELMVVVQSHETAVAPIDDLLQRSSDLITLREPAPNRTEQEEEDPLYPLGTFADLEELLRDPIQLHAQPNSSSPSDPGPHTIQVVAQVHVGKDDPQQHPHLMSIEEHLSPVEEEQIISHPIVQATGIIQVADDPAGSKENRGGHVGKRARREVEKEQIEPRPVLKEIQVGQVDRRPQKERLEKENIIDVVQAADVPAVVPEAQVQQVSRQVQQEVSEEAKSESVVEKEPAMKDKVLFRRIPRRFIRINRCNENEVQVVNNKCCLPNSEYQNQSLTSLYNLFTRDDVIDESLQTRAASHLSGSLSLDSFGRLPSGSRKRSTLEREAAREGSSHGESTPQAIPLDVRRERITGEPEIVAREQTPRPMEIDLPEVRDLQTFHEILVGPPPLKELSPVQTPIEQPLRQVKQRLPLVEQSSPLVAELLPVEQSLHLVEELLPRVEQSLHLVEEPLPPTEQTYSEIISDYKERQQQIIDMLSRWNFKERLPTIRDVSRKPINVLNVARAFSDLLVLCQAKLVILIPEDDCLEIQYIKKGPKF